MEKFELMPTEWMAKLIEHAKVLQIDKADNFPKFFQYWESYYHKGLEPEMAVFTFLADNHQSIDWHTKCNGCGIDLLEDEVAYENNDGDSYCGDCNIAIQDDPESKAGLIDN